MNQLYPLWVFLGLLLPAIVGWTITRNLDGIEQGLLWGGLVRIFFVHHAVWSVNSLCHLFGDRPFPTKGSSTNNIWLALISLGGSWHNNHHAFPTTADNRLEWWQFDFCGMVIRLMEKCKLVWGVKFPSPEVQALKRKRSQYVGPQL